MRIALTCRTLGICVLMPLLCAPGWAQLENQPANKHSTLVDKDGKNIRDDDFATMIKALLVPSGTVDVLDAKFIFQQCYGGGMLDDLNGVLGNVKWVGGSASKHDETSIGQVSTDENKTEGYAKKWVKDPPENWWTQELKGEMVKNQTLLDAIKAANKNDGANKNGNGKLETGQSISRNDGDKITLDDPAAKSHHAILWGGDADHMRHFNNIKNTRAALISQWGPVSTKVTITTLFGDGKKDSAGNNLPADWKAQPATEANLKAALQALQAALNTDEQFFFYSSDHGGSVTDTVKTTTSIPSGGTLKTDFSLAFGEFEGMLAQSDNQPLVEVTYQSGVSTGMVDVNFNGVLVGQLSGAGGKEAFPVKENMVDPFFSEITIVNNDFNSLFLDRLSFYTGGIDSNPPRADCPNTIYCGSSQAAISTDTCFCSDGSVVITMSGGVPNQFAMLLVGSGQGVINNPPGSTGDLCLGGASIGRYSKDIGKLDGAGSLSVDIMNANTGGGGGNLPNPPGGKVCVPTGQNWNFQFWYRAGANPSRFSQAIQITFK